MQRQALTTEQEREFIMGVIDFIKNELIRKSDDTPVTDKDVCIRISGVAYNQLSAWRRKQKNFTTSMKTGLYLYLVGQQEAFTSQAENTPIATQLNAIITQLSTILNTRPWVDLSNKQAADTDGSAESDALEDATSLEGKQHLTPHTMNSSNLQKRALTTADENALIKKIIIFLKTKVLAEPGNVKVSDITLCTACRLPRDQVKCWRKRKPGAHFTVLMKQALYQYLSEQQAKFATDNDYKMLVEQLSQILETRPWMVAAITTEGTPATKKKRDSSQLSEETLPAAKRTKVIDTIASHHMTVTTPSDSLTVSSHSFSTSSTPALNTDDESADVDATNTDLVTNTRTPDEPEEVKFTDFPTFESSFGESSALSNNMNLVSGEDKSEGIYAALFDPLADELFNLAPASAGLSNLRRFSTFPPTVESTSELGGERELDNLMKAILT